MAETTAATSDAEVLDNVGGDDVEALASSARGPLATVQHWLHRYPTISPTIVLVLSFIVFTFLGNGRFATAFNMGIMLQQTAVLATLAVGQTLIILTAGIDLAVGKGMILTHLVMAKLAVDAGVPAPAALLIGAVVGMALGLLHGFLVTRVRLPPFIATLGTFFVFNSVGLVYSGAKTVSGDDIGRDSLLMWTGKAVRIGDFAITSGVLVAIVLYCVVGYILAYTAWGRHVYATGDDPEAARLAGIEVNRVLVSVYVAAGFIYAIAGWVQIGRAGSASSNAATDINLGTITAVVIGGTSLFGGRGRLLGTLVGALIVTVFQNGLKIAGVNAYYENLAVGSLILVAVALDQWIRKVGK